MRRIRLSTLLLLIVLVALGLALVVEYRRAGRRFEAEPGRFAEELRWWYRFID
jgi:hypothetical protein